MFDDILLMRLSVPSGPRTYIAPIPSLINVDGLFSLELEFERFWNRCLDLVRILDSIVYVTFLIRYCDSNLIRSVPTAGDLDE